MLEYLGGKCVDCGVEVNLEIDHVDPAQKSFYISRRWWLPWEVMVEELDKCVLRCHSCHVIKTYGREQEPREKAPF